MSKVIVERNQDATIYIANLDEKITNDILYEFFIQFGPVKSVYIPKDRITQQHQGYAFVEFNQEEDADYAVKITNMIKLYNRPIRVAKATANEKNLDIGANLFINNLDSEINEKLLYDIFSAFGVILRTPRILRDPETGNSKGCAFINYGSFEASDAAVDAMNGQYLCNRTINVSYAFKQDSYNRERHGSVAERLLAAKKQHIWYSDRPNKLFAENFQQIPSQIYLPPPPAPPLPQSSPAFMHVHSIPLPPPLPYPESMISF